MLDTYRPGYIRVSTKEQELGLESQMQQLIDYGVRKEDIFVDRGVSGTSNSHSERMAALMLAVQTDRARHNRRIEVVVAKLDRWGRDPEETIALLKELHVSGACLTSLGENIHMVNPDSGTGMLIVRIMLAVAAQERDRIAERTREALVAVRARGVPLGPPPKLTSNDVAWIRDKHKSDGWGAQRIAKALPKERNVEVSKYTVQKVLGQVGRAKAYVPKDNHKYVARAEAAAKKRAKALERMRSGPSSKTSHDRPSSWYRERMEARAKLRRADDTARALAMDEPPALSSDQVQEISDCFYYAEANDRPEPSIKQVADETGISSAAVADYLADPRYLDREYWAQLREEADHEQA